MRDSGSLACFASSSTRSTSASGSIQVFATRRPSLRDSIFSMIGSLPVRYCGCQQIKRRAWNLHDFSMETPGLIDEVWRGYCCPLLVRVTPPPQRKDPGRYQQDDFADGFRVHGN